jgi:hypothetical protein
LHKKINDFSLDAGILYHDGGDRETTVKLYEERYVFIAPKALITSNKKEITWVEVAQIPLCLLTPNMKNRQLIDEHFLDLKISPKIVTEASDFTASGSGCWWQRSNNCSCQRGRNIS